MIEVHVIGTGVIGPGLNGWGESREILAGGRAYVHRDVPTIKPAILPANERRRCGPAIRLSVQAAQEAVERSGLPFGHAASVFATSEGSAEIVHHICESLANPTGEVSPTHFHNSVHNAAAGYWTIAAQSHESSNTLTCDDASFGAGLLEAALQAAVEERPVLLVAYDARLPEPLHSKRPFSDEFACALMLAPTAMPGGRGEGVLCLRLLPGGREEPLSKLADDSLERLRTGNPAARSLPLLAALASAQGEVVILEAPSGLLKVEVKP